MSKQTLFENVGGNRFRLITENVEESKSKLVREGLRKVFKSGNQQISYKMVQNVGLGYIKEVNEARKCALQEARFLAKECGYMEDEAQSKFVKEEQWDVKDYNTPDQIEKSEEKREVQISKEIVKLAEVIKSKLSKHNLGQEGMTIIASSDHIIEFANQLITMHGAK